GHLRLAAAGAGSGLLMSWLLDRGDLRPRTASSRSIASGAAIAARGYLTRRPGPPGPLFDVTSNHPAHDLRGRQILLRPQAFKHGLLAGVDQYRQPRGALFDLHYTLGFHLHLSHMNR